VVKGGGHGKTTTPKKQSEAKLLEGEFIFKI
jgi:hypothetical protein